MKQKIVIKVQVRCHKCRSKAMATAADTDGVISVSLQGKYKDMVVVIGDGVDSVCLAKRLGKKLGHAILETVEEMEEKPVVRKPPNQSSNPSPVTHCASSCQQSRSELYAVVCDPSPSTCILM